MSEFVVILFSNRTQHVHIDVLSAFTNIICGVHQGSVLAPLKLYLYLLHPSTIFMYHNIGYDYTIIKGERFESNIRPISQR